MLRIGLFYEQDPAAACFCLFGKVGGVSYKYEVNRPVWHARKAIMPVFYLPDRPCHAWDRACRAWDRAWDRACRAWDRAWDRAGLRRHGAVSDYGAVRPCRTMKP